MKEKIKCFNGLLEKTLEFKHDKYFTDLTFHSDNNSVWLAIYEERNAENEIIFFLHYNLLSIKDIKVVTDKIIKLLSDIEEGTDIKEAKTKLPLQYDAFIDVDKFIKGDK